MHRGSCGVLGGISIHAPRVGSDGGYCPVWLPLWHFNPRSPCGERQHLTIHAAQQPQFQSTLPVWGATDRAQIRPRLKLFQSTLPVWGATRLTSHRWRLLRFQSTLPVWGATLAVLALAFSPVFQSTLPVWGATDTTAMAVDYIYISIHAPRVGSDAAMPCCCGGPRRFQSTLPVWGATPL